MIPLEIVAPPPRLAEPQQIARLDGATMGTSWSVTLADASPNSIEPVRRAIQAVLDGIVARMSTWDAASDICTFNAGAAGSWHTLPDDFSTVLDGALMIAQASDGAYDPTIGALVDLWGFGPSGPREAPSDRAIAAALAQAGWQRLKRDGRTRIIQPGGLHLDLSSIAKGFAVDRVAACVARLGLTDFLVEVGGELRGHGVKPDGTPWWVELEQPAHDLPQTILALHEISVATSGDQQCFIERDGRRLAHILDPRNGYPVRNGTASVTVIHRACMLADAWATALMVPEPGAALALASAQKLAARILVRSEAGWDELMTPAFAAMLD